MLLQNQTKIKWFIYSFSSLGHSKAHTQKQHEISMVGPVIGWIWAWDKAGAIFSSWSPVNRDSIDCKHVPQNSGQSANLGVMACRKWLGLGDVMGAGPSWWGHCPVRRGSRKSSVFPAVSTPGQASWGHDQKGPVWEPGLVLSAETLILDFHPTSRIVRSQYLLFKPPSAWCSVMAAKLPETKALLRSGQVMWHT